MDKRAHIISVAIELFAKWGFDNTSIREISQKAGVNVAMINYYFGSKEKLFEAMIEQKSNYSRARLEEIQANTALNDLDKINIIIEEYVTRILSNPDYHRIIHQEMLLNTRPDVNESIKNLVFSNFLNIRKILEDGISRNVFRKIDPDLTIASLFGTINQCMLTPDLYLRVSGTPANGQCAEPLKKENMRIRMISHLQQMMAAHLMNH